MIKELMYYTTDSGFHPTKGDIVDKINEIIKYLNDKEKEEK